MTARLRVPAAKPRRRYPLEPLARLTHSTPAALVEIERPNRDARRTWLAEGVLEPIAERMAFHHGYHPYEVWPEMIDHAIEDANHPDADIWAMPAPERQRIRDRANHRARYYAGREDDAPPPPDETPAAKRKRKRREKYLANRERELAYQAQYRRDAAATLAAKQQQRYADPEKRARILERQRAYDRARAAERRGTDQDQERQSA